jgi:hypothetical protein
MSCLMRKFRYSPALVLGLVSLLYQVLGASSAGGLLCGHRLPPGFPTYEEEGVLWFSIRYGVSYRM